MAVCLTLQCIPMVFSSGGTLSLPAMAHRKNWLDRAGDAA